MPWTLSQLANHGIDNPIVARLSLQTLSILKHCNASSDLKERVGKHYLQNLMQTILSCHDITEAYRTEFNRVVKEFERPSQPNQILLLPQISDLNSGCRNFVYAAKNAIRDILFVYNMLYGQNFSEASEFYERKRQYNNCSLLEFSEEQFGKDNGRHQFLSSAKNNIEYVIRHRNATDHIDGHSGTLIIKNFEARPDGTLNAPQWYREPNNNGDHGTDSHHIGHDFEAITADLLELAEFPFIVWAQDNLLYPNIVKLVHIPEEHRHPHHPVYWDIVPAIPLP